MNDNKVTDNSNLVSIRLDADYLEAFNFLLKKKMQPRKLLKKGGQDLIMAVAQKNRFTLRKIKDIYF
jgi:hypothetical protein